MNAIRRRLQWGLFAPLLLVVCQWLAVAHATQHELTAPGTQAACEVCIVAHGAGALPAPAVVPARFKPDAEPLLARLPTPVSPQFVERRRARAPPSLT
jgi:hypothetical protein